MPSGVIQVYQRPTGYEVQIKGLNGRSVASTGLLSSRPAASSAIDAILKIASDPQLIETTIDGQNKDFD